MPGSVVDLVLCVAFVAISALIVFIITSGSLRRHRSTSRSKRAPSVALLTCPLFGHLSLLGRYPHRSLTQLSRRLGPVYSLQLGRRQAVVISGRAAVRAAFSTAGSAGRLLDDRPVFELYRHYAAGCSISFGRRGAGVRLHRRLARRIIRRLIASGLAETIVEREATSLVANWTDDCGRCLDPADDVTTAVSSALFSMCYGLDARIDEDPEYHQLLRSKGANSDMFAIGKQGDLVPGFVRRFFTDSRQMSSVLHQMATHVRLNDAKVEQRSAEAATTAALVDNDEVCVLDAALAAVATPFTVDRMCSAGLTHAHLTSLPLEFLSAGSETSSSTLLWILRFVAMHPDVQRQVHAELDRELAAGQPLTNADRRRLPYVEAVVLEAMRLAPVVPLALPHFASVDVDVSSATGRRDLTIPAGSIVIANLWSVGRDPHVWNGDVDVFRPERFLRQRSAADETTACAVRAVVAESTGRAPDVSTGCVDNTASGSRTSCVDSALAESFYPFSFGARRCVGEALGRLQVFIFFATIMRSCQLQLHADDTTRSGHAETYGDVIRPAPYKIRIVPR